ncbi:MAG: hypothetical protein RDV48_22860 [Candidatus Eremiobacteraeota bacterium]|nr:hypothetical protein [Candidatus Eremiobacteraeota bacterium]
MDSISGSKPIQYTPQQRLSDAGGNSKEPVFVDGFEKSNYEAPAFNNADALKRMAAINGKAEVGKVEDARPAVADDFSDLALSGPNTKELLWMGI